MDFSKLPPNNKKAREPEVKNITRSPAEMTKDKGRFDNVTSFISKDINDIKNSIIFDYVVPGIKDLIIGLIDQIFFKDRPPRSYGGYGNRPYTSYNGAYRNNQRRPNEYRNPIEYANRNNYDYRELTWKTRGQAEKALYALWDILDEYKVASIADLFDIAQCTPAGDSTGNNYGWFDLSGSEVIRTFDGKYCLKLPTAVSLV